MVWARTKIAIWDYVFEPVHNIVINYTGPKPSALYKKINELIRTVFNVPESYIQEKNYNWEKLEKGEKFTVDWEVTKIFDKFTFLVVEITLKGAEKDNYGKAGVTIRPRIITEYPQDTIWQQNLLYEMLRRFWHTTFYHRKRMEYLDISKNLCVAFESAIKQYMDELKAGKS